MAAGNKASACMWGRRSLFVACHLPAFSPPEVGMLSAQCHLLCDSALIVGRTPWSARDALVPLLAIESRFGRRRGRPTRASAADRGPPHSQISGITLSACRIGQPILAAAGFSRRSSGPKGFCRQRRSARIVPRSCRRSFLVGKALRPAVSEVGHSVARSEVIVFCRLSLSPSPALTPPSRSPPPATPYYSRPPDPVPPHKTPDSRSTPP